MASSSSLIVSIHSNLLSFFPFCCSSRMLFAKPRVYTVVFQPLAHLFDAHVGVHFTFKRLTAFVVDRCSLFAYVLLQ